ncbi:3-dehydroquinate synthase [Saccharolobus solfataricus]|uniref:3-dehydroquinate synthase n=3 Tax=Saccharolobus solfataricus TaxID=2287 RepID=AROB_SACS2|nr:3-dehydroquinate synthase [Saccharolobus solfataricus]Q980I9.1 RecName: Full=3-dehydroquinate synthase; Short=DHQS [Saccharolobus solfataricus P2]AAK40642.1 3-dehydroquinate synthase (aroB) [Saccharolobus solfataricus P2]AKA73617.1 3-dehydroquinate synthase [Saccharolobus solfataricus]AKA76315.1 3-dehydroquinate synthase [Saccharolobus solfataricus]AKA79007.1 3-dehydroquinate synthase [Saccharolobus solfataricus]AZF68086.1 3-dehydroquinate synthase [Saccharolobus solfataricus]
MREILEDICCSEVRVVVGEGSLSKLSKIKDNNAAVIYSRKISIADKINKYLPNAYFIPINDGESTKELSSVISLVEKLFEKNFDRGDYIIGVGGGTVTDVAGFLASIYLRGLNLINVPTTFLGMVDAAIGGKNGVNFNNIKNLIGTFYQPSMIISDLEFLETLPIEELKKGLAEVIKYGLTLDKELYDYLSLNKEKILNKDKQALEDIIFRSTLDKLSIVKEDERETKGIRIVLNFGHTIGHAIEAGSSFNVPHGYAISVGMVCEAKMAEELGYAEEGVVEDVLWLLQIYGLPYDISQIDAPVDLKLALNAINMDKKHRKDVILIPFPTRIGSWKKVEVPLDTVKGFAEQCLKK